VLDLCIGHHVKDCSEKSSEESIMMETALFSLTLIICLQWSHSMPPPHNEVISPENKQLPEEEHDLGQLFEDVDVLKNTRDAQVHQIDILQV